MGFKSEILYDLATPEEPPPAPPEHSAETLPNS